jgi:hypothetical protein
MSSLRKKFPSCFVRVKAKNMPTVICGYSNKWLDKITMDDAIAQIKSSKRAPQQMKD